jgi:pimeloyl-ACP methyl ester carboxylesterase
MKSSRTGHGRPLLLVHGLGSTSRVWEPVLAPLTARKEVIVVDLPGHGGVPAEPDSATFAGLARSLEAFLDRGGLTGCDMAGSSLGAQLVLEMARRGKSGAVVALDPGGFWRGLERAALKSALTTSLWSVRGLKPGLPLLTKSPAWRTLMLASLSARPWALDPALLASELKAFAETGTLDALIDSLAFGPPQAGPAAPESGPVTIGWGRHDRLCNPVQAQRALAAFPGARLHWFGKSGHFPMWDEPDATAGLILSATSGRRSRAGADGANTQSGRTRRARSLAPLPIPVAAGSRA